MKVNMWPTQDNATWEGVLSGSWSHKNLAEDVTIPITYIETEDFLGRGTVGEVFKVHPEVENHGFPTIGSAFALKTFPLRSIRTKQDFENEIAVLQALSNRPQEHIVTHLASWTLGISSYICFHSQMITSIPFVSEYWVPAQLDTKFILWLLQQLKGIAEALD